MKACGHHNSGTEGGIDMGTSDPLGLAKAFDEVRGKQNDSKPDEHDLAEQEHQNQWAEEVYEATKTTLRGQLRQPILELTFGAPIDSRIDEATDKVISLFLSWLKEPCRHDKPGRFQRSRYQCSVCISTLEVP